MERVEPSSKVVQRAESENSNGPALLVDAETPTEGAAPRYPGGLDTHRARCGVVLRAFPAMLASEDRQGLGESVGSRLAIWLSNAGPLVGLQLRLSRRGQGLEVSWHLLLSVRAPSEAAAEGECLRRCMELCQILAGHPGLDFAPIQELGELLLLLEGPALPGGRAATTPLDVVPLPAGVRGVVTARRWWPEPSGGLGQLARLLGDQPGRACVVVSVVPRERAGLLRDLRARTRLCSQGLAILRSRLEGRQVLQDGAASMRHYPEDFMLLREAAEALDAWWSRLQGLAGGAVRVRVAVLADSRPTEPLLQTAHRAFMGTASSAWQELTSDQARLLLSGPHEAVGCPLGSPALSGARHDVVLRETICQAELAELLRPPDPLAHPLPGVPELSLRLRPPPRSLAGQAGPRLGEATLDGHRLPVRVTEDDLARHVYLVGKTGVGKSTALLTLMADLGTGGAGFGLIDPHGDLADGLLERLGDREDVVLFDPTSPDCPALNPLASDGTMDGIERAVESITATMFRLYPPEYMGPMFDRTSRALLIPLLVAGRSLSDMSRMIHQERFRRELVAGLDRQEPLQDEVWRYWKEEFPAMSRDYKGDVKAYTISKYEALLRSSSLRRVLSGDRPQLDVGAIMDRGGVLVARLPQGTLGPVSAWFLGMTLMSRIQEATFGRSRSTLDQRRPFTLVLDEFQNFLGSGGFSYTTKERTLGPLLSEARKFGLRLVLANQFVSQLDPGTRQALFGNVGSLVTFRVGSTDSHLLAEELGSDISPEELRDLPLFTGVARVLQHGVPSRLFHMNTIPPWALGD